MKKFALFLTVTLSLFFVASADGQAYDYANPLNHNSFTSLIYGFLTTLQAVIGLLAVVMLVVSGIAYITSAGNPGRMEWAKKIAIYTLSGFAIVVAGPTLLKEIKDMVSGGGVSGSAVIENAKGIKEIAESVMVFLLSVFGILAVISFIVSGVMYITSAGDSGQSDKAKKMIVLSIIGVVVTGAGLILIKQVLSFF